MGLDLVELVMEIEESFEVRIPDREAEGLLTVGDLYHWLVLHMGRKAAGPCLSGVTFYRVRRALTELGVPRRVVTPRADLQELLPEDNRRVLWDRFGRALGSLRLRALRRPLWLFVAIGGACVALYGAAAFALQGRPDLATAGVALVVGSLLSAALAFRLTKPLAVCFPPGYVTVRDVVHDLLKHNYGAIAAGVLPAEGAVPPGREREIWDALCRIVGENLGVDPGRLTESTSWADLGAD